LPIASGDISTDEHEASLLALPPQPDTWKYRVPRNGAWGGGGRWDVFEVRMKRKKTSFPNEIIEGD
jgi:hypothetical protein